VISQLTNAVSNYYETLGVAKTATPEELKAAFRKLAKSHHPDLGGDVTKFQQINEAYETLGDPDKRALYDHQQKNPFSNAQNANFDPDPFGFGFSHPINDVFNQHFSFVFNQQGVNRGIQKNRNVRINLEMDLLETLEEQIKVFEIRLTNGKESIEIKIPAGIADGQVISLRHKGDNEFPNQPRGNLEIVIQVRPHERFIRQDQNILTDVTVDCFEAVVGTDVELETPSGKHISLRIPAGTQNGTIFGISDEGFPTSPRFTRGKLLVRINILIPRSLTPEQIILVREIQKKYPVNS
jgi:curved DNA-binding protein